MFGKDGEVRLADFGLARDSPKVCNGSSGTPLFMAPEVLEGKYTHKCDIWALGCVTYILITGKHPFKSANKQQLSKRILRVDYSVPDYFSAELRSILAYMLKRDPKQRPTAKELWDHAWFRKFNVEHH